MTESPVIELYCIYVHAKKSVNFLTGIPSLRSEITGKAIAHHHVILTDRECALSYRFLTFPEK